MRYIVLVCLFSSLTSLAEDLGDVASLHKKAYELLHSNPDQAFEISIKAERMARDQGHIQEEANSIYIQAWILKEKKFESGKSFVLYLKALEILNPIYEDSKSASKLYADLLNNTASILRDHHAHDEALKYYAEALEIYERYELSVSSARLHWNIAKLHRGNDSFDLALKSAQKAIQWAYISGNEQFILNTLICKSLIEIDRGEYEEGRKTCSQIDQLEIKEVSADLYKGINWHNIGHSYASEGKNHEAITAYEKARELKKSVLDPDQKFITYTDLCESYMLVGDYEKSQEYGQMAIELYDHVPLHSDNYRVFEYMSTTSFKKGLYEESRAFTERFIQENDRFLEVQDDLLKVKDQFKMEMLAAGFFLEINSEKSESMYVLWLTIISSLFTIILMAGIMREYYTKRSIKAALREIEKNSPV